MIGVDWTDSTQMLSQYFSVREALWLSKWGRLANEADGLTPKIRENLLDLCSKMDQIRVVIGHAMQVTSCFRPVAYNKLIGGAAHSAHTLGLAMDFTCEPGANNETIKKQLVPLLDKYVIRMEKGTVGWIHLDLMPVKTERYFKP